MNDRTEREALKPSRREMLTGARKKLKYVVPAMWVLAAAPEQAFASAPASGTCTLSGGDCNIDSDCCSLNCQGMTCQMM